MTMKPFLTAGCSLSQTLEVCRGGVSSFGCGWGGRPGPGWPAKHWALSIQSRARRPFGHEFGVVDVAALGDDQTEVFDGSGDAFDGLMLAELQA